MNNPNKNKNDNVPSGELFSWGVIFICMLAFFPVGILLLLIKLSSNAKNAKNSHTSHNAAVQKMHTAAQQPAARQVPGQNTPKSKDNRKKPQLRKKSGKFLSVILLLLSITLFIIGMNTIVGAAQDMSVYGLERWPDLAMGIFLFNGGLVSFFSRNISVRRFRRFKQYYAVIGERGVVPIPDIASAAGESERTVRRDLQAMLDEGYFGSEAYIDNELNSFVLYSQAAQAVRQAAQTARQAPRDAAEKPENQYMAIILELRQLNETIADISISDKIDRIEELTAKIFRIVEENPAKLPQIRRFMNYYLPTTLKLLHSYATLEKQGIHGENITAAKENIDRILNTLATGYEQQLDQLFKSDVIDISSDINVLENMMRQDGLTDNGFRTLEGN